VTTHGEMHAEIRAKAGVILDHGLRRGRYLRFILPTFKARVGRFGPVVRE
jgi:hypothetical protein